MVKVSSTVLVPSLFQPPSPAFSTSYKTAHSTDGPVEGGSDRGRRCDLSAPAFLVTSEQNSSRTKANEVIRISQDHL